MKLLILIVSLVLSINAASDTDLWTEFKKTHSKTYENIIEENLRFSIFQSNIRKIDDHNARYSRGEETYSMKANQFADLTDDEFRSIYLSYKPPIVDYDKNFQLPEGVTVPDGIDWRAKGVVTEIKDQGECGSCWAFSTTGGLEGQYAIKHGTKLSLSEEELLECSKVNKACKGGEMNDAFNYVKEHGIATEASYPYTASKGVVGNCTTGNNSGIVVTGYVNVPPGEDSLKNAVATTGPISIAMNGDAIRFYLDGIFFNKNCGQELNHGVVVVGYGTHGEFGHDYWIVKNSWGTAYGEHGYLRIVRNANQQCGVSLQNSYPIVA